MVFGKKKPRDRLEEDQVRTADACELAGMLQSFLDGLKTRRDQAEDLKAELEEKRVKYKAMLDRLDAASVTLTGFLKALQQAGGLAKTKEA